MNEFQKQWITSTCAPESITNIKSDEIKGNYLDVISNEDKSKRVFVISTNHHIQAIGLDYASLISSESYRFDKGLHKIAQLLELSCISI